MKVYLNEYEYSCLKSSKRPTSGSALAVITANKKRYKEMGLSHYEAELKIIKKIKGG